MQTSPKTWLVVKFNRPFRAALDYLTGNRFSAYKEIGSKFIGTGDFVISELSDENLIADVQASLNAAEMARRKFRDIACIAGLVFQGYPGKNITGRHLQASSSLFFKVLTEFDKNNLLIKQAYTEVFEQQIEEVRLRKVLERIKNSNILLTYPEKLTPFSFPVKVDMIRENMSSERLEDRIKRMTMELERN